MRIAALQTTIAWEQPAANFERLAPKLRAAAAAGARLVVLPEMYACGFSMDTARIAEPPDGPSVSFLRDQAADLGLWVCGSVPERAEPRAEHPANTLIFAGPGGELYRYRKRHPFTFAGEHEHYLAGHDTLTRTIEGVRVSAFICYDLRFADDFWALAERTDLYVVVANWPQKRREHWKTLLRARAIENQAWVVGLNRVGEGGGITYGGDSMIIDPWGEIVVAASRDETMLLANIDADRVREARTKFPVLADRL
ncbi:2-oxoglutaramate amidase [Enhygromyxa salina]|uniref:2-oxoglutaramate amidase n=1 Tax=Enhygromyxa salina TaxID=215803 RepID=A0A2S9Y1V9_9BACT|nr:nitrilase-related carbon-nitrogen hydrolase [Enhygromyxa salina]PRP99011.1 2-oxoglutaramate amidase [Enhygromyxa salina]